jgi:uncharacterized membrane protein YhaH (DUF805 family)
MQEFITDYIDTFKNWSNIEGKVNRNSFWMAILVAFLIGALLFTVTKVFDILLFINYIYGLFIIIPFFTLGIRRFHDVGRSGTTWVWIFLPVVGWLYILILFIKIEK